MFYLRIALFILISLLLSSAPVWANDFSTQINTTYSVNNNTAVVSHLITVTNNSATQYPTGFDFIIPGTITSPVKVTQSDGKPAVVAQEKTDRFTNLSITFSNPVVGQGKSQSYTVEYQNPAVIHGEVPYAQYLLPGVPGIDEVATASSTLLLPENTCPDPVTTPEASQLNKNGPTAITFTGHLPSQSLFIRCTEHRFLSLLLHYFVTNTNLTPIETQITLPPDTEYQQLFFKTITPDPLNISTDINGNVIASFKLEPKESKQIEVTADAKLSAKPVRHAAVADRTYLAAKPYWPVGQTGIKSIVKNLTDPQSVFDYITNQTELAATVSGIRTGGSLLTINPTKLQPIDLVDSYITLARSKGIMARRLIGFAQSPNQFLWPTSLLDNRLHVWADYFDPDKKTWIQVDPIWQQTANADYLPIPDLNHLVLAINGADDATPYPVGYYQSPDSSAPDFKISDQNPFEPPPMQISGTLNRPLLNFLKLSNSAELLIENHSRFSIYDQALTLTVDDHPPQTLTLTRLPLEGKVIIPITLPPNYENATLTINQTDIPLATGQTDYAPTLALTAILAASLGGLAFIAWRLLVFRRKK